MSNRSKPRILNVNRDDQQRGQKTEYSIKPERSYNKSLSPFPILKLPPEIRAKVWITLGFGYTKTLRLVCPQIKSDIDTIAGISAALDSTYEDFPFFSSVALRKVAVHEMIVPPFVDFLKYPLSLHELEIRGEISIQNFNYIIKSCPNLAKILLFFNKFVIDHNIQFFPLPKEVLQHKNKPLHKLSNIKLVATTKKVEELQYVYKTVLPLLTDALPVETKIESLQILISHKGNHVLLTEIMLYSLLFLRKHAESFRYLNLMYRTHDPHAAPSEKSATENSSSSGGSNSDSSGGVRKDSSFPGMPNTKSPRPTSPPPPIIQLPHHHKDVHADIEPKTDVDTDAPEDLPEEGTEALTAEAESSEEEWEETNDTIQELSRVLKDSPETSWPKARYLHYLILSVPQKIMEYIVNFLEPKTTRIESLNLEALAHHHHHINNWELYSKYLSRIDSRNLKSASFHHVKHENSKGLCMPVDMKIFRKCKKLKKLIILCEKREDFSILSKAKNISKLPKSLREIHFERLLLTPSQVFNICFCFSRLDLLVLSYWSRTNCHFCFSIGIIKWLLCLDATDILRMELVDTKIRFRNHRGAVRSLQKMLAIKTVYQDFDETRLTIDIQERKTDERDYAPRISIIKVTRPKGKVATNPRLSRDKKGATRSSIINLNSLQSNSSKVSLY